MTWTAEVLLEKRGIKPTALRIMILQKISTFSYAFSLNDLENTLPTVDKSTLFRTLTLFHNHALLHSIDDGTKSLKYALCQDSCNCAPQDLHVHFSCTECHKTFCMTSIPIPKVQLPHGFELKQMNFVLKGLCPECKAKVD